MLVDEIKKFAHKIDSKIYFDYDLKKAIGLILEEKLKFILNQNPYLT